MDQDEQSFTVNKATCRLYNKVPDINDEILMIIREMDFSSEGCIINIRSIGNENKVVKTIN